MNSGGFKQKRPWNRDLKMMVGDSMLDGEGTEDAFYQHVIHMYDILKQKKIKANEILWKNIAWIHHLPHSLPTETSSYIISHLFYSLLHPLSNAACVFVSLCCLPFELISICIFLFCQGEGQILLIFLSSLKFYLESILK